MCGITCVYDVSGERSNDEIVGKGLQQGYVNINRGKDSTGCGILFTNGEMKVFVTDTFEALENQIGQYRSHNSERIRALVVQTRYTTSGINNILSAQPMMFEAGGKVYIFEFNGTISNAETLAETHNFKDKYNLEEPILDTLVLKYIMTDFIDSKNGQCSLKEVIEYVNEQMEGACNICIMSSDGDMAASVDKNGVRRLPYSYDKEGKLLVLSSEQKAIDNFGGNIKMSQKLLKGGEIISLDMTPEGIPKFLETTLDISQQVRNIHCIVEFLYLMRADSQRSFEVRNAMGKAFYAENPEVYDPKKTIAMSVPNSGYHATQGFSEAAGIDMVEGVLNKYKNKRTFINPIEGREEEISTSYYFGEGAIEQLAIDYPDLESIMLIDDSVINGGTMRYVVPWLKQELRRVYGRDIEIHIKVPMRPVSDNCHNGIVTNREKLVTVQYCKDEFNPTLEEIDKIANEVFSANSMTYISHPTLQRVAQEFLSTDVPVCDACMTGRDIVNYQQTLPGGTRIPTKEVA